MVACSSENPNVRVKKHKRYDLFYTNYHIMFFTEVKRKLLTLMLSTASWLFYYFVSHLKIQPVCEYMINNTTKLFLDILFNIININVIYFMKKSCLFTIFL